MLKQSIWAAKQILLKNTLLDNKQKELQHLSHNHHYDDTRGGFPAFILVFALTTTIRSSERWVKISFSISFAFFCLFSPHFHSWIQLIYTFLLFLLLLLHDHSRNCCWGCCCGYSWKNKGKMITNLSQRKWEQNAYGNCTLKKFCYVLFWFEFLLVFVLPRNDGLCWAARVGFFIYIQTFFSFLFSSLLNYYHLHISHFFVSFFVQFYNYYWVFFLQFYSILIIFHLHFLP